MCRRHNTPAVGGGRKGVRDPFCFPVQYLKGVGPYRAGLLAKMGITTVYDLLYHLPSRYEDRSYTGKEVLRPEQAGTDVTIGGLVVGGQEIRSRSGLLISKLALNSGGNGVIYASWFNQPFIMRRFPPGTRLLVTGRLRFVFGRFEISVREYETANNTQDGWGGGKITPVYPTTEGLSQKTMRRIIADALKEWVSAVPDPLPPGIGEARHLMPLSTALTAVHFPETWDDQRKARERLAAEELLMVQVALAMIRGRVQKEIKQPRPPDGHLVKALLNSIPYRLTGAQQRVWKEISQDMQRARPMQRLLQGDVGAGKTIVAALALAKAAESGYQGALMAPTELLAEQHYLVLQKLLAPLGISIHLLTGGQNLTQRRCTLDALSEGRADVVIGTHALIQKAVSFARLGLVVIDEQHRFGVRQRSQLQDKGLAADMLVMTATPIPRTLALTVYGDLDFSVIDELPPGREPICTELVRRRETARVWRHIRSEVAEGRQAYVVCPLVEESEKRQSLAAIELKERLEAGPLHGLRLGLAHGRMRPADKEIVMEQFRNGEIQVLVATTIIEVGVDVPRATTMVVFDAERFGLAQLHQLRGRVGRAAGMAGRCFLVSDAGTPEGLARLKAICSTNDGFALAETDLKLRGPGEFLGVRQSGRPLFRAARFPEHLPTANAMRGAARRLVDQDPDLASAVNTRLRQALYQRYSFFIRGLGIS